MSEPGICAVSPRPDAPTRNTNAKVEAVQPGAQRYPALTKASKLRVLVVNDKRIRGRNERDSPSPLDQIADDSEISCISPWSSGSDGNTFGDSCELADKVK